MLTSRKVKTRKSKNPPGPPRAPKVGPRQAKRDEVVRLKENGVSNKNLKKMGYSNDLLSSVNKNGRVLAVKGSTTKSSLLVDFVRLFVFDQCEPYFLSFRKDYVMQGINTIPVLFRAFAAKYPALITPKRGTPSPSAGARPMELESENTDRVDRHQHAIARDEEDDDDPAIDEEVQRLTNRVVNDAEDAQLVLEDLSNLLVANEEAARCLQTSVEAYLRQIRSQDFIFDEKKTNLVLRLNESLREEIAATTMLLEKTHKVIIMTQDFIFYGGDENARTAVRAAVADVVRAKRSVFKLSETSFRRIYDNYCKSYIHILKNQQQICTTCYAFERSDKTPQQRAEFEKHQETYGQARQAYKILMEIAIRFKLVINFDFKAHEYMPRVPRSDTNYAFELKQKILVLDVCIENCKLHFLFFIEDVHQCKKADIILTALWTVIKRIQEQSVSEIRGTFDEIVFLADNTVSQNKNRYLIVFMEAVRRHLKLARVIYQFLTVGHTHGSCDRRFGIMYHETKERYIFSIQRLHELVKNSEIMETVYNFRGLLLACKALSNITDFQMFCFEDHPRRLKKHVLCGDTFVTERSQVSDDDCTWKKVDMESVNRLLLGMRNDDFFACPRKRITRDLAMQQLAIVKQYNFPPEERDRFIDRALKWEMLYDYTSEELYNHLLLVAKV